MKYKIIKASEPDLLVNNVNDAMAKGWMPQGGITVTQVMKAELDAIPLPAGLFWFQAMTRKS